MLRAFATLSVLAVVSFAFSAAVALMIAAHASPADAAPAQIVPAIDEGPGTSCPALPGADPRCPALRGDDASVTDVVEAARRAGCPAFRDPAAPVSPAPPAPPHPALRASLHDAPAQPTATS